MSAAKKTQHVSETIFVQRTYHFDSYRRAAWSKSILTTRVSAYTSSLHTRASASESQELTMAPKHDFALGSSLQSLFDASSWGGAAGSGFSARVSNSPHHDCHHPPNLVHTLKASKLVYINFPIHPSLSSHHPVLRQAISK
jgi:hypothetical protein